MYRAAFVSLLLACTPKGDETGWPSACFVPSTLVDTPDGPRPIGALEVGDVVLSGDPETGAIAPVAVTGIHGRDGAPVYRVRVGDAEIAGVTAEHPFWCETEQAWRTVDALVPGHELLVAGDDGTLHPQTLDAVTAVSGQHTVRTLTVGGQWHTFFAEGVLVHNKTSAGPGLPSTGSTTSPPRADSGFFACFVDDTWIATPDGPIEIAAIEVGDPVISADPATGRTAVQRVTRVIRKDDAPVFEVVAGDARIRGVTGEHPFWCETEQAWRTVDELVVGHDLLVQGDDGTLRPRALESVTPRRTTYPVRTLTVDGPWHTFLAEGVLVHNKQPPCEDLTKLTLDHEIAWDDTQGLTRAASALGYTYDSILLMNLGIDTWTGDTNQTAAYCSVVWNMNGVPEAAFGDIEGWWLGLEYTANTADVIYDDCAPRMGDGEFCEDSFGGYDPATAFDGLTWRFAQGGEIDPTVAPFVGGNPADQFWGAEIAATLTYGGVDYPFLDAAESIAYGYEVDANFALIFNGNYLQPLSSNDVVSPTAIIDGYYPMYIPWIWTFQ